ncbi:uncharacterized protein BDR25DRAFT_21323 [Lindgomyces ingoldianus]|uniref:Uncharacterized protein n=1 Tax=Lindgomyces ingoldianus TaxID=673940 RepID=A0ACB6QX42_9PLEO|nr:uncharacterized protein BDR25DRAFT_21323 [Lindgomyces ingoldianus]KAF2471588.1 hypothetical protein BDR25DRAFT_21323 [Lindgomyces ingoldianus]
MRSLEWAMSGRREQAGRAVADRLDPSTDSEKKLRLCVASEAKPPNFAWCRWAAEKSHTSAGVSNTLASIPHLEKRDVKRCRGDSGRTRDDGHQLLIAMLACPDSSNPPSSGRSGLPHRSRVNPAELCNWPGRLSGAYDTTVGPSQKSRCRSTCSDGGSMNH